jgi:hypothetical protein
MTVDFAKGLHALQKREAVKRHPESALSPEQLHRTATRRGKVSITQWVDPAVRKQVQQIALDHDREQCDLVNEAINLLFEKYGKPPIA